MKTKFKFTLLPFAVALFSIVLVSCNQENVEEETPAAVADEVQGSTLIPKYFMGEKVMVRKEEDGTYSLSGSDVRVFESQLSDTPTVFTEDLNAPPEVNTTNKAANAYTNKWPNNTVTYVIRGLSSTVRAELQKSMEEWSSKTNIRFKERTNESNYVTIAPSGENSNSGVATLGMYGARGYILLGARATAVVIIHEIGHTLGYIHEQNRSDRDDHIIINYENIIEDNIDQFQKNFNSNLITKQFDINSVMMYGSYTFSKNKQPTITDLAGNLIPRRQAKLSPLDIEGTNSFYPEGVTDSSSPCDGVASWSSGTRYAVGDRVTYANYLFERQFGGWSFLTSCD